LDRVTVQLQGDMNVILAFQTVKIKLLHSLCQLVFALWHVGTLCNDSFIFVFCCSFVASVLEIRAYDGNVHSSLMY